MAIKQKYDYDIIVIGSGAAGSSAATIAAHGGKKVAIIEYDKFGGESSNWGDVPTNALLNVAHLYDESRRATRFGIRSSALSYNFPALQNWRNISIKRTGASQNKEFYQEEGIDIFAGRAHFISQHEIMAGRKSLTARYFIVATGSKWKIPDIQGIENIDYLTPRNLFDIVRPPRSLYIVGAGKTGVELAQLMSELGTKVYISDIAGRLLPNEDEDVGVLLDNIFSKQRDIGVLTQTRTLLIEKDGVNKRVTYVRGGVNNTVKVEAVLVATGRVPETDLGLGNVGVTYNQDGIEVNKYLQTNSSNIYAAGDVLEGGARSTHASLIEGRVVANNILHPRSQVEPDYLGLPRVTYTFPEIASAGITENECIRRDLHVRTGLAPLHTVARSNTSDFRHGFVKIVANKKGIIIGGTIVAPNASDMIHEISLAIRQNMTVEDLANMPHAFLSWSEAIRVAASRAIR